MNTHDKIVKCRSCGYVGPCDPTCCEHPDFDGATADEAWAAAIEADRKRGGEPDESPMISAKAVHAIVAGVLYDFMGMLTTSRSRLVLSEADEAGPAVDAIVKFAILRNLRLDDAAVFSWRDALDAPQPAEPVKTDSAGYTHGPSSDGGMDPRDRTTLNDPIETSIRRFELLAADRNHGAVDPMVGAQELRAYKNSLAPQPAEPVKVPSDAELFAIHDEYFPTMVLGRDNYLSFARALLARYGARP